MRLGMSSARYPPGMSPFYCKACRALHIVARACGGEFIDSLYIGVLAGWRRLIRRKGISKLGKGSTLMDCLYKWLPNGPSTDG